MRYHLSSRLQFNTNSWLTQRPSWIPFFDDVQAIIFLAPLAFNLMLEEDSRVNRLVSTSFPVPGEMLIVPFLGGFYQSMAADL